MIKNPHRIAITIVYAVMIAVTLVTAFIYKPQIMEDDAAITFRYANRIVEGKGFSYNNHEHLIGTSAPLYTLILAGLHASGFDTEAAALIIGYLCLVGVVILSMRIAQRLSNITGAVLTGLLLTFDCFFVYQCLNGMETALALFLALLFIDQAAQRKTIIAGIILGLAVFNKLDAGLLALAFASAYLLVNRRFPGTITAAAFITVLPWFIFSYRYTGSIFPNSMIVKMTVHAALLRYDHLWIIKHFRSFDRGLLLLPSLALLWLCRRDGKKQILAITLLLWTAAQAAAYSLISFGDNYPWYLTALTVPPVILGSAALARLVEIIAKNGYPIYRRLLATALTVTLIVSFSILVKNRVADACYRWQNNLPIPISEANNFGRRLAGMFISQYSDPSEIGASAFGWPAYEMDNPFNDQSGLNSHKMINPVSYIVLQGSPWMKGSHPPLTPNGYLPLATFNLASDMFPGTSWFVLYGLPDSKIARSGRRYLQYRLFELPIIELDNTAIRELDLESPGSSKAVFNINNQRQKISVVFQPEVLNISKTLPGKFVISVGNSVIYQQEFSGGNIPQVVTCKVPGAERSETTEITFSTETPIGNWCTWKNVKIIIGDARIDLGRITSRKLKQHWSMFNGE